MGKGRGLQIYLDCIFRVAELVLLLVAIALFMRNVSLPLYRHACNCMCVGGSTFVILLSILLWQQLMKGEEQDQKFVAFLLTSGYFFVIFSGVLVCIFSMNRPQAALISGIVGIVAGVALFVDSRKC